MSALSSVWTAVWGNGVWGDEARGALPALVGRLNSPEDVLKAYMRLAEARRLGEISGRDYEAADQVLSSWTPGCQAPQARTEPPHQRSPLALNVNR